MDVADKNGVETIEVDTQPEGKRIDCVEYIIVNHQIASQRRYVKSLNCYVTEKAYRFWREDTAQQSTGVSP
jgi:hypothetical protein